MEELFVRNEIINRQEEEFQRNADRARAIKKIETAIANWDIKAKGRAGLRRLQVTLHSLKTR